MSEGAAELSGSRSVTLKDSPSSEADVYLRLAPFPLAAFLLASAMAAGA